MITTKKNPQGRHRVNGDYLLTGKLFCGHCKSPMTGVSGTGRSGNLHYYYVCQKRRTEKTCDKKNVRRDEIELQVAQAIKDYALKDDVIEWIADSTVAYNERKEAESKVGILEDQLAGTEHGIKNIMSAIEQGIITETTKSRLVELESERAAIKANIAAARADIVTVSRETLYPAWRCSEMAMFTIRSTKRAYLTHSWSQCMLMTMICGWCSVSPAIKIQSRSQ